MNAYEEDLIRFLANFYETIIWVVATWLTFEIKNLSAYACVAYFWDHNFKDHRMVMHLVFPYDFKFNILNMNGIRVLVLGKFGAYYHSSGLKKVVFQKKLLLYFLV